MYIGAAAEINIAMVVWLPAAFEAALRHDPSEARIYYNRGVARLKEARVYYNRGLAHLKEAKKAQADAEFARSNREVALAMKDANTAWDINPSQVVRDMKRIILCA